MTASAVACRPRTRFDFARMIRELDSASIPGFDALRTRRQWLAFGLLAVSATVVAQLCDQFAWQHMRDLRIYDKDLGRLLRLIGYLPTWLIVAGALWLQDRGDASATRGWGWRGGLVILAPTAGGAVAELSKMLVRRLRPSEEVFAYAWRPYAEDPTSTRGLGMPSSHTMVAFAAAAAMARLFPRAWWIWYLLATGCAVSRVLAVGHFLSDTVAAAFLGYAVGVVLTRAMPKAVGAPT